MGSSLCRMWTEHNSQGYWVKSVDKHPHISPRWLACMLSARTLRSKTTTNVCFPQPAVFQTVFNPRLPPGADHSYRVLIPHSEINSNPQNFQLLRRGMKPWDVWFQFDPVSERNSCSWGEKITEKMDWKSLEKIKACEVIVIVLPFLDQLYH